MENQIFRDINTELDLNGPYLSFTTQPTTQSSSSPGTVSYTGLATVSYGASVTSPENIGTLEYQWYEVGVGALTNGGNISGATTGTLTVANVASGTDDNREFYLGASYLPAKLDYETGNPPNEPLNSNTVGINITPNIQILSQPVTVNAAVNTNTAFAVSADLTDGTTAGLLYQWYIDGVAETDRTKSVTITSSSSVSSPHSYSWTGDADHVLPSTASNIRTTIAAAAGGSGGSDAGGPGAPGGRGRGGNFSLEPTMQGKTLKFRIGASGNGGSGCANCYGNGGVVSGPDTGTGTQVTFTITKESGVRELRGTFRLRAPGQSFDFSTSSAGTYTKNIPRNRQDEVHIVGNQGLIRFEDNWKRMVYRVNPDSPGGSGNDGMDIVCSIGRFASSGRALGVDYTYQYPHFIPTITWGYISTSIGSGTRGGGSGHRGWSGGGGGAGASTYIDQDPPSANAYLIVAGGGAGGGGGSHNRAGIGNNEIDGRPWSGYPTPVPLSSGQPTGDFDHYGGDGGGSGGGGGGSPGGDTGNRGWDNNHGAYSGKGGGSRYDAPEVNLLSDFTNGGNGYASLNYDSTTTTTTTETRNTTFSGTRTPNLTIKSDWNGTQTIYCKVSHPTASNSPVDSSSVTFTARGTPQTNEIKAEHIGITGSAALETVNLTNGEVTWGTVVGIANDAGQQNIISFYSPNKDMTVQLDMWGGRGEPSRTGSKSGGEGGYSRIQFTMIQNQEYVIAGLSTFIGAPSLYRGANLMAVVGQGGAGGEGGDGGDGGGCNISGEGGLGSGNGIGGLKGGLSGNGTFGSIYQSSVVYSGDSANTTAGTGFNNGGGTMIVCPKGVYWRQQGKSQCASLGTQQYRLGNGTVVSNTTSLTRGYKGGYNIIQTAGSGSGSGGRGGCGSKGGWGGTAGGGGGGAGFADSGLVTIVNAIVGGSTDYAKVILRVVT